MYQFILDKQYHSSISTSAKSSVEINNILKQAITELNQIYQQIPKPECDRCGNCCDGTIAGNPSLYSIEFLNINQFLNRPSNKSLKLRIYGAAMMYKKLFEKQLEGHHTNKHSDNSLHIQNCPALNSQTNLCLIYDHRPLMCRLYGLDSWSKEDQDWAKHKKNIQCEKVTINEQDHTKTWDNKTPNLLHEQLKQLSDNYTIANVRATIIPMVNWLTLKFETQGK